ncbi:MAG: hypothetical protein J1F66_02350 [Clostridiales bacterium]|nr:hypothetical protein [Clostridiales bacterium]
MKQTHKKQEVKDRLWLRYVVMAAVMAFFSVLIAWWQRAFVIKDTGALFGVLSTAFFIPGIVTFFVGISAAIKSGVLFSPLVNLCKKIFQLFKQDRVARKYRNFARFNKALHETKPTPWFMVIDGAVFSAIGGVFLYAFLVL